MRDVLTTRMVARARPPEVADRLNRTLDDLQTIIEEIRTTVFQLKSPLGNDGAFGTGFNEWLPT
jgi:signal transduction histidine kinase